jgi:hypothetical protein
MITNWRSRDVSLIRTACQWDGNNDQIGNGIRHRFACSAQTMPCGYRCRNGNSGRDAGPRLTATEPPAGCSKTCS